MRLLEFVPCGCSFAPEDEPAPAARRAEATAPLSATTAPAAPEKRRRRAASWSAAQWRPSLGAISEDGIAAARLGERAARPAKAKAKAKATPRRALPRAAVRDDFRHFGVPTVVPAFAPTAFLF